jgi:hypothetical protein
LRIAVDTVLVQDEKVFARTLHERTIVLGIRRGSYFDFNRIGSEIWKMLAEPCRVDQLLEVLCVTHNVNMGLVKRDVTTFLQTLLDHHLVRAIRPGDRDESEYDAPDVP